MSILSDLLQEFGEFGKSIARIWDERPELKPDIRPRNGQSQSQRTEQVRRQIAQYKSLNDTAQPHKRK